MKATISTPLGAILLRQPVYFCRRCRHCTAPVMTTRTHKAMRDKLGRKITSHLYGEAHCDAPCPIGSRCRCEFIDEYDADLGEDESWRGA